MLGLSKKTTLIKPSATLAITARAKQMKEKGIDVIGFGAGEPDFDTPDFIKESAKKSIDSGFTKYTPSEGILELKSAICRKFKKDNNLDYEPSEIVVSCGAKHSIFNVIQVLCDPGDEVILPAPYWVSYPEQIKLTGANIITADTSEETGFKVTPRQLRTLITPKTKLFILNSPSNPTGAMYTAAELEEIAGILAENSVYCISDEIYEKIIYDANKHVSIASFGPEIKNLTVVVNGLSKAYSMTGWRIGYTASNKEITRAMTNLQSHSTSNPVSFCQTASITALGGPSEIQEKMVMEFQKRRNFMVEKLNSMRGISCRLPEGAFYVFPNVSKLEGKKFGDKTIKGSVSLTELLLDDAKIAVVPGIEFGKENYLRLSYATSLDLIKKGMERLENFVKELK